jgi:hypothetical protein
MPESSEKLHSGRTLEPPLRFEIEDEDAAIDWLIARASNPPAHPS